MIEITEPIPVASVERLRLAAKERHLRLFVDHFGWLLEPEGDTLEHLPRLRWFSSRSQVAVALGLPPL